VTCFLDPAAYEDFMDNRSLMLINGHNLNVEQNGPEAGPAVLLLHHGLGSVRAWREQIPALVESGYHVIAYDRWGYGDSDSRLSLDAPGFNDDLADLEKLLDHLALEKVALVGHSDGGTIALYMAARYPERVNCLVTMAAHIYVEPEMQPGILGIRRAFEIDRHFRKGMQYAHGEKFTAVFDHWFDGWYQAESLSWDMRPLLARVECPTLVVQGEQDEHATPQHARDIAKEITGAELWLVPKANHMLPQEQPALFNAKLLQFLSAHVAIKASQVKSP
jgi:pimeloyl-ACP methyl ester carboxylesterase